MEIIGRKAARLLGMNKYFTGNPCVNGHVTYRYVTSGVCYDCLRKNRGDVKLQIDSSNYRNDLNYHESKIMEIQRKYSEAVIAINSCIDTLRNELIVAKSTMLAELEAERANRRELSSLYADKVTSAANRKADVDQQKAAMIKIKVFCPKPHLDEMGELILKLARSVWAGFELCDVWYPATASAYVHAENNKLVFEYMSKVNRVIL